MNSCFLKADILLPQNADLEKWAVIACDQFTSDRKYWDRVEQTALGVPSTFHMIFPEIDLENKPAERILQISQTMREFLNQNVFQEFPQSFVYVERTLQNGVIRPGIVGAIDLEQYNYDPSKMPSIGATEQTVLERVPPRIAVRRAAELEFSHVILFCEDFGDKIIKPVSQIKDRLVKLYDFMLMEGGGHICGWLVSGEDADDLCRRVAQYMQDAEGTAFLVADGNHSLVTAKHWYEELKKNSPDADLSDHPARYALVELENILDPSIVFEPINRVIFDTEPYKFLKDLQQICTPDGCEIQWFVGQERGTVRLHVPEGELPIAILQKFMDQWLAENKGRVDYIHDSDAVQSFAKEENTVGLVLPVFDKKELFAFGASGKILPRKTFSLGFSREKRYYLEGRRIR